MLVALLVVLAQCGPDGPVLSCPWMNSDAEPIFSTVVDYQFPYVGGRMAGLCTGDPKCIAVCAPGIFDGGCEAQCQANDGGQLAGAVFTNPGTAACVPSFIPGMKALDITAGSQAPSVVSDELNYALPLGRPGTMFTIGMGRGDAGSVPDGVNWWQTDWTNPISVAAYYEVYYDPLNWVGGGAGFFNAPYVTGMSSADTQLVNFYGVNFAAIEGPEWDGGGAGADFVGIGLVEQQRPGPSGRHALGSGYEHVWGADIGRTHHLNGPWGGSPYYNAQLSASERRAVKDKVLGVYNLSGALTPLVDFTPDPRAEAVDHSGDGGNVDLFFGVVPMTDERGALSSHRAYQNFWATDPLEASGWTDVGTPLVNSNVLAGPFDTHRGAVSGDEIVDDSAGAFEGKRSPLGATDDGGIHWWSASCIMRQGRPDGGSPTLTKARIAFSSTGGTIDAGAATCDFTGLTMSWTRNECRASYFGGTAMKADVLVGNAASDQGSVGVAQCQLDRTNALNPPVPFSSPRPQQWNEFPTGNFPTFANGGELEIHYLAKFDPVEIETTVAKDTYVYLLDAFLQTTSDHCIAIIPGELSTSDLFVAIRDGHGVNSDLTPSVGRLTAGTTYAIRVRWVPTGGGKCRNYVYQDACAGPSSCVSATLVASDTTGTATCPCQPERMFTGQRLSQDFATTTGVWSVMVRELL